ncbi:putative methyltransferase family protein isoform X2 [Wolffia australiana]
MANGEGDQYDSSRIASSTIAGSATSAVSDETMTRISRHYFTNDNDRSSGDGFSVDIIENIQEEYGMFVWPCAIALAEYVWQQRSRFSSKSVVELGAGTSLPGLVAAKVGANVTLTDDSKNPEVLENMRKTCHINGLRCRVLGLTWGEWDPPLFSLSPDFLLGADVLYDNSDFDDLFATATFLMKNCPGCVFITAYHARSGHHLIEYLMSKWGCKCTRLLDAFSTVPPTKASNLHGSIQLAEIVLNDHIT